MDITSFILGISSVIVVVLITGVVIGLVKVKQLFRYQRDLGTLIDNNQQNVFNELRGIWDAEEARWKDHNRILDSRLDKLIARLDVLESKVGITKQKKQLLND